MVYLDKMYEALTAYRHSNLYGAETGIFHANLVNTMATDALAPSITQSSAAMILVVYDKQIPIAHGEGVPLPLQTKCHEMMVNANISWSFIEKILVCKKIIAFSKGQHGIGISNNCIEYCFQPSLMILWWLPSFYL